MKLKCSVIEDLIPLYIDNICSEESKNIVENHLEQCKTCNDKYNIQKDNIIINHNIINKNLKLKDPFKKIKKYNLIKLIIILLIMPLIYFSFIDISGNGVGLLALYGRYKTNVFLNYIENEDFIKASRYVGFSGGIYEGFDSKDFAKKEWIDRMKELQIEGIDFISHRDNHIKTDDRFTSGNVTISLSYEEIIYDFILFVSTNSGKVEIGYMIPDLEYEYRELTEVEKMLMDKISKVIFTYNPG